MIRVKMTYRWWGPFHEKSETENSRETEKGDSLNISGAMKEPIGLMVERFAIIQSAFMVYFKRVIFIFVILSLD